jgi:hypothetical protein
LLGSASCTRSGSILSVPPPVLSTGSSIFSRHATAASAWFKLDTAVLTSALTNSGRAQRPCQRPMQLPFQKFAVPA